MSAFPPPPPPIGFTPPEPVTPQAQPAGRPLLRAIALVGSTAVIVAGGLGALWILSSSDEGIDSADAAASFDAAHRALDDNLDGNMLDRCPTVEINVLLSKFVSGTGIPELYDTLDRGKSDQYVFFDDNVDRPLLQCSRTAANNVLYGSMDHAEIGLMVTRSYPHGFEEFTIDLLAQKPDAKDRCIELDFDDLGEHEDGQVAMVTCLHDSEYDSADFRELAWFDDNMMVIFAVSGPGAPSLDAQALRDGLVAGLPVVLDNLAGAPEVQPLDFD